MSYNKEHQERSFNSIQNVRKMVFADPAKASMNFSEYNFCLSSQDILDMENVSSLYLGEFDLKDDAIYFSQIKEGLEEGQHKSNILIIRNDSGKNRCNNS
jgi:hypothetical protein